MVFRDITLKAQSTNNLFSPCTIADDIVKLQNALTAFTFDPDKSVQYCPISTSSSKSAVAATKNNKKTASSLKTPFIATEESVIAQGTSIMEESTTNNQTVTTGIKTRSRAW